MTEWRLSPEATSSNTNANLAFGQTAALNYEWTATYTSRTSAGLYLFASAASGSQRGNSYRIWQDATHVRIYENAGNVATLRVSFAAANAAEQTHSYKVSYDPLTGRFDLWRNGGNLGAWTDDRREERSFVSLRTDELERAVRQPHVHVRANATSAGSGWRCAITPARR
ncbi:MAG: hypothetical protein IPM84_26110 [Anaerolineae bacterium]|nr:hypothetical protein [Anaerolineae bacterium]